MHSAIVETAEEDASEDEEAWSSSSSSASDGETFGLRAWFPDMYRWIVARTSTKQKMMVTIGFLVMDAARFFTFESAVAPRVNTLSVLACAEALSLFLALAVSLIVEGWWAYPKIFEFQGLWRFLGIAILFSAALGLNTLAYQRGLLPSINSLVGKVYLPMSALAACVVFKREYGVLEWLALSMMMLGIVAFLLLRYRCHINGCSHLDFFQNQETLAGMFFVLLSAVLSSAASTLAERVYTHRSSLHLQAPQGRDTEHRYYIYLAQMDTWSKMILCAGWLLEVVFLPAKPDLTQGVLADGLKTQWFGQWTTWQFLFVLVLVGQKWLAGWVVLYHSTVSKAVLASISIVLVVVVEDALENKFLSKSRFVPSLLITVIVVLAALICQTGLMNMMNLKAHLAKHAASRSTSESWGDLRRQTTKLLVTYASSAARYSVVIAYILTDSFRSIIMLVAQSNRYFVPQTLVIMSAVASCMFANVMTYRSEGIPGLRKAWEPKKILKVSICGLFQALTSTLMSIAFALGTSPSLVVALGKVYIPMVTILSRFLLGKFYSWLEWFALIILTSASICFGLMDAIGKTESTSPVSGMLCVVGSATSSCLMSLLMELLTRSETDPFIIHKVRLDVGSIFFSTLLLPVMGFMGTMPGNPRTDLAYWTWRPGPDYWGCYNLAVDEPHNAARGCDQISGAFTANATLIGNSTDLAAQAAQCVCGNGVLLGWGNYVIYVALFVSVFHGWITGVLVTSFSSVFRAVADGLPIVIIYFFLDAFSARILLTPFQAAYTHPVPWPPQDWARNAICLILPLSSTTFSRAAEELKKAVDDNLGDAAVEAESSEDEDKMSDVDCPDSLAGA